MTPAHPLIDVSRLTDPGAVHGQLASQLADGGLMLTCDKHVAYGWRAAMLHVPDLMRFDVRAYGDTVQAMLRPQFDGEWGAQRTYSSRWDQRAADAEVPWRAAWVCAMGLDGVRLLGEIELAGMWSEESGGAHLAARAIVRPYRGG